MNPFAKFFSSPRLKLPSSTLPRRLGLLDIGARGGVQWPWDHLSHELLDVDLVEPDPVEAVRLQQECKREGRGAVIPKALWRDSTMLRLNINRSPATSSVFPSNMAVLDQFPDAGRYVTERVIELAAETVDGLASTGYMPTVDFAKIDVQGAELAVLQGGARHFADHLVGLG